MKITTGQILGKAHRLCEFLRSNEEDLFSGYGSQLMARIVEGAVKWHIGNAQDLPVPKEREIFDSIPLRLPTKEMLVEFDNEARMADGRIIPMTGFLLCYEDDGVLGGNGIGFLAFGLIEGRFHFDGGGKLELEAGGRRFAPYRDWWDSKAVVSELHRLSFIIEQMLLILHCTNVRSVNNAPSLALNKKRQKQGKPPLFTYKTLHVLAGERGCSHDPRADEAEARRSPRLHFRRGHVRQIGDGRITWVQQCMVGNRKLGIVEKTYALDVRKAA